MRRVLAVRADGEGRLADRATILSAARPGSTFLRASVMLPAASCDPTPAIARASRSSRPSHHRGSQRAATSSSGHEHDGGEQAAPGLAARRPSTDEAPRVSRGSAAPSARARGRAAAAIREQAAAGGQPLGARGDFREGGARLGGVGLARERRVGREGSGHVRGDRDGGLAQQARRFRDRAPAARRRPRTPRGRAPSPRSRGDGACSRGDRASCRRIVAAPAAVLRAGRAR